LAVLVLVPLASAKSARVSGVVFTLGADRVQILWPNARVTLKDLKTGAEVSTVSNDLGAYSFTGLVGGSYEITVALSGFETITKPLTLEGGDAATLDFQLVVRKALETVNVTAESPGVDLSSSSGGTPTLTYETLKSAMRLGADFQQALPLLPGVVRGLDG